MGHLVPHVAQGDDDGRVPTVRGQGDRVLRDAAHGRGRWRPHPLRVDGRARTHEAQGPAVPARDEGQSHGCGRLVGGRLDPAAQGRAHRQPQAEAGARSLSARVPRHRLPVQRPGRGGLRRGAVRHVRGPSGVRPARERWRVVAPGRHVRLQRAGPSPSRPFSQRLLRAWQPAWSS